MASKSDPDDIQKRTVKGARGTIIHLDSPRDDSSLELSNVAGKDLGKGDLGHSLKGTSVAN